MLDCPEIVIIGAGPSGIAAGVQLARYGLKPIIIEKKAIGGLVKNAWNIENYLPFTKGIAGVDFVKQLEKSVLKFKLQINFEKVLSLNYNKNWEVITDKKTYNPGIVIVATGTKPRLFPDEINICSLINSKIFYEIYPILNSCNKEIAIAGNGDAAFDYSLNLARKNRVYILNKHDNVKCLLLLKNMAEKNSNIKYIDNIEIKRTDYKLDKLSLFCQRKDEEITMVVDFLVGAIGRQPDLDFLDETVKKQSDILVKEGRLYFTGDVTNGNFRQISIATGDGIKAAMEIYSRLKN